MYTGVTSLLISCCETKQSAADGCKGYDHNQRIEMLECLSAVPLAVQTDHVNIERAPYLWQCNYHNVMDSIGLLSFLLFYIKERI